MKKCVLSVQGTLWIWFCEHALDAEEDCLDVVDCGPFFFEDVETDVARHVDIGMIHRGDESNVGGGIWIGCRKYERQLERQTAVWL
jgi:hypothetical protein